MSFIPTITKVLPSLVMKLFAFFILLTSCFLPTYANTLKELTDSTNVDISTLLAQGEQERESLFPHKSLSLAFSNFTWGIDLGSSIDLVGNDMSTFDVDAIFGYKNKYIRVVGAGVGLHRNFGNANTFIPIYAIFRSSFRTAPSLFFLNFKAGYSFNTIQDSPTFGDASAALGVGINLAMSQRFQSHIILSYGYRHFSLRHRYAIGLEAKNDHIAQISFGVNF